MSAASIRERFAALLISPRELWLVYVLKFLESFAYFASSLNLALFLTKAFSFTDLEAGALYSAWGVATGLVGFAAGPIIDRLGVRPSLIVGGCILTFGRALFATATTRSQLYVSLFVLQPIGMNLAIPGLSIAIRRVTDDETRTTAYGLFYVVMNVAALASGLGTDALRSAFRTHGASSAADEMLALRRLFWLGTATSAMYTCVAYWSFRPLLPPPAPPDAKTGQLGTCWREASETVHDRVFWRLVAFSGVVFGANTVFRHMDSTLPKFMERTLGENAAYGTVYAINPAIIIIAVPVLQAYLADRDPYNCVIAGTMLTTAATVILGIARPSYLACILFMIVFSVGEATYSPRLYEYAMVLAPEGREGIYGTLSAMPLFLVKALVGVLSGELLGVYCPERPPRICGLMWLIIAATAVTTPVGLVVFRRWLYTDDVRARMTKKRQEHVDGVPLVHTESSTV